MQRYYKNLTYANFITIRDVFFIKPIPLTYKIFVFLIHLRRCAHVKVKMRT